MGARDFIFGDSGGFSAMTLGVRFDPRAVLRWQLRCSLGPVLDHPPVRDWTRRRECLAATVENVKTALPVYLRAREAGTSSRWWGVVHGRTRDELLQWWEAVSRVYPFDGEGEGWGFKPYPLNDPEAVARVLAFARESGIRRAHFFGTSGLNAIETLVACGADAELIAASFDSTSPFLTGGNGVLLVPDEEGWRPRTSPAICAGQHAELPV